MPSPSGIRVPGSCPSVMKKTFQQYSDSETSYCSEGDSFFSFPKLSCSGVLNSYSGSCGSSILKVMKRTHSNSEADSEGSFVDKSTSSDGISEGCSSTPQDGKKYRRDHVPGNISKSFNDSGLHNTSLGSEMDSDVYQRLLAFSQKDLSDIITTMLQPDFELNNVLDEVRVNTCCLLIFMKIVSVVCKSNSALKIEILLNVGKRSLVDSIRYFLQNIIDDSAPPFSPDILAFLEHVIEFFSSVFVLMPEMMTELNLKEIIAVTLKASENLENSGSDTFIARFRLIDLLVKVESYPTKPPGTSAGVGDFRACTLYPTGKDLQPHVAFDVEPNLTKGMYVDVEHYLNVNFRLLRECFHQPIKAAIQNYWNGGGGGDRMSNANFSQIIFKNTTLCFEIKYDKWDSSAQLGYGALVVFSDDNFQTMFFGSVEEWNAEDGTVVIRLLNEANVHLHKVFNSVFVMLDTTLNLCLYDYPVFMNALSKKTKLNFPMAKYLINAEIDSSVTVPSELEMRRVHRRNVVFDLFSEGKLMQFTDCVLDTYQCVALKSALTNPVTLIAGPRGTGKTLLAVKIVQVLLHSHDMRNTVKRFPILMICRSNEALDEFLFVVRNYTNRIVRIGGSMWHSRLKDYNLRAQRRADGDVVRQKDALFKLQRQIRGVSDEIRTIDEYAGVLSFDLLKNVMVERHWCNLDEERLLTLLLDEDGFTFDYVKSAGTKAERLEASVLAELRLHEKLEECANAAKAPSPNSTSKPGAFAADAANEFFIDEVAIGGPSEAADQPVARIVYAITVQKYANLYREKVGEMRTKYDKLKKCSETDVGEMCFVVEHVQMLRKNLQFLKTKLASLRRVPRMNDGSLNTLQQIDFHLLNVRERWMLYGFWVFEIRNQYINWLNELVGQYTEHVQKYNKMLDLEVLSKAQVVGVTTACVAKFPAYFGFLQPSIVIVEEATEIIEAEIVATLSKTCDQLILLGDLYSMKPLTPNTKFSKQHHMDVSLFERLLNNGFNCHQLKIQRNIPPEINSVLRSTFISDLYHNVSPEKVALIKVKGFAKNVFFLNNVSAQTDEDLTAATFVSRMCWYLMMHSIVANEITVLTVDKEHACILKETLDKTSYSHLKQVNVATLDTFRSRTNKIVLLSFINTETGIMDVDYGNRVLYMALTRATQALYMVGDFEFLLRNFQSWSSVQENLQKWSAIGDKIILTCERHRKISAVSVTGNFWTGCGEICGDALPCHHSCSFLCHLEDSEHSTKYMCPSKTPVSCSFGHTYLKKCGSSFQACPVEVTVPSRYCGHSVTKKCGDCVYTMNCSQICNELLSCGHRCPEPCHRLTDPSHKKVRCKAQCGKVHADCIRGHICAKLCSQRCGICFEMESCQLRCGHETKILCSFDVSRVKCYEKCSKICEICGERCKKYCFEDCQPCTNKILKIIRDCGHEKLMECGTIAETDLCDEWVIVNSVTTPCGHTQLHLPCRLKNEDPAKLSSYCCYPCGATLMCGHLCVGTCGSCFRQRLHIGCSSRCNSVFVCGHSCGSSCEGMPQICNKVCAYYCKHQKCNSECGLPCIPCKFICERKCKHSACTRTCSEFCDRDACYEPCELNLACGHPCLGFCGEPCPSLCRFCDQEFLFLNYPNCVADPKTRFVLLADCQHVVESRALEEYLYRDGLISLKKCPHSFCQKYIVNTSRYRNLVNQYYQHIKNIKKMYLNPDETALKLSAVIKKKLDDVWILFYLTDMNLVVNDVLNAFVYHIDRDENRGQRSAVAMLQSLSYYADLMLDIGSLYSNFGNVKIPKSFPELSALAEEVGQCVSHVMLALKRQSDKISIELIDNLHCEVNRFHKIIDYCLVIKFGAVIEARQTFPAFCSIFCAPGKFTDERNDRVNDLMCELQRMLQCPIPIPSLGPGNVRKTEALKRKLLDEKRGLWYVCRSGHYYRSTDHHNWSAVNLCPRCRPPEVDVGLDEKLSDPLLRAMLNSI